MDLTSKWQDWPIAVIDLETTGFDQRGDRIIEVGVVRFEKGEITDSWGSLVDPRRPIPKEVTDLTGIHDHEVRGQPVFADLAPTLLEKLEGCIICAYNLDFDKPFLTAELERCGFEWPEGPLLDPLVFAREAFPKKRSRKLGKVSEYLGISLEEAHRAVNDSEATGKVWYALVEHFQGKLPEDLGTLLELQSQWKAQQDAKSFWKKDKQTSLHQTDKVGLGAAYLFGEELDPLRALYGNVPEVAKGEVALGFGHTSKAPKRHGRARGRVVKRAQSAR